MIGSKSHATNEVKLLASDGDYEDYFGRSVSISGDVALVGANMGEDFMCANSGSAYIFRYNGSSWVQEDKLLPSDGAASDYCGYSVSINADVALVGAPLDEDNSSDSGSAYVFDLKSKVKAIPWVQLPLLGE
jgi:hypothetical protein